MLDFNEDTKQVVQVVLLLKVKVMMEAQQPLILLRRSNSSIAGDKLTIDVSALGLTDNKLTQGSYYITTWMASTVTDIKGKRCCHTKILTNGYLQPKHFYHNRLIGADDNYINDSEKDATALRHSSGAGTLSITKIEFLKRSNTVGTAITSGLPVVAADGT
ncbi:MAG: hypothetical protein H0A76_10005 [Candidatus Thiodubiliella endoseptemdiera]|uniref:Uncharacterized protein n=1 Tax=Candidatus Thiodubiliella endoseptemdiera TaxID=2738886 RepID=A0A853F7M9_9GAMM|nr:hypothetical protein [Candidatus Thiodubiliella endoseptemdiera]